MTKWGETAYTPCCKDIVIFISEATVAMNSVGYEIGFTPLQTSLALKKYANPTVRKYMAILANNDYLTVIKGKNKSTTPFYKISISQLQRWSNDWEKSVTR